MAKDYLVSSSMNISEIADRLRFRDHAVFTRFFFGEGGDVSYKIQEYKFIVTQMLQSASYLYVSLLLSRALSFY